MLRSMHLILLLVIFRRTLVTTKLEVRSTDVNPSIGDDLTCISVAVAPDWSTESVVTAPALFPEEPGAVSAVFVA